MFTVRAADWHAEREKLHAVRRAVFIVEQNVPEELEWDEADADARHVLATLSDGRAIGTGRLLRDCRIGRMAVLREWRGRGVGAAIMQRLLEIASEQGCTRVTLHAQTHALDFYARFGFAAFGEEFDEAGIPHRQMALTLARGPAARG